MRLRKDPLGLILKALLVIVLTSTPSQGKEPRSDHFLKAVQIIPGAPIDDRPVQNGIQKVIPDTVWYGGHDGNGYAVEGGIWDFEDGMGGPDWQGWYGVDETANSFVAAYRVDADDFDCPADAPIIKKDLGNVGQIWFGAHGYILDPNEQPREISGDGGCWVCDAGGDCTDPATRVGYGNKWCQQADSPPVAYSGGDITVEFLYFLDCEGSPHDFLKVLVVPDPPSEEGLLLAEIDDGSGGQIAGPDHPATFMGTMPDSLLPPGTTSVALRFEFSSDGGWSDEDGGGDICSTYGPFGADSVVISETDVGQLESFNFEEDDEGWTFRPCPSVGNYVDLHHISEYEILDPCECGLEEWIMAFHDENYEHPEYQANSAVSAIVDRTAYQAEEGWNDVFWTLDIYAWLRLQFGVLYRPGMYYYPWTCAETDVSGWSPRMGQSVWFYVGYDPVCFESLNNFTVDGVPGDADLYRGIFQLLYCCECFGIDCEGPSNETPLIDNIRIGLSRMGHSPTISLDSHRLMDAFAEDGTLNPSSTGRSDDADTPAGADPPWILSDSLGIAGPVVGGDVDPWEAHLWFRIVRKGPMQETPAYSSWKSRLLNASFPGDPETEFVGVRMDSSMLGSNSFANKYCSFAHPDDGFFDPAFGDRDDENEILPDRVFTPGTEIDYFITGRYIGETDMFFLPDTTGGFFFGYEILPSMRWSGEPEESDIVWPCVLYWDAYNRGAEPYIESALNMVLQPVPGIGPNHDRFDQLGTASCCGAASIYRPGPGRESGGTLAQLLGYRVMILNTGDFSAGAMHRNDFFGVEEWLRATVCGAASNRRAFIANGDLIADIIENLRPTLLTGLLGARVECRPYREADCPPGTPADSSFCVSIIESSGSYPPLEPFYALGNGCPNVFNFSVLQPTDGVGNRNWWDYDGGPDGKGVVSYAQITNDQSGSSGNFRTVIDGYSYHHITTTLNTGTDECEADFDGRVEAAANEISTALDWIFDGATPTFCTDPCEGDLSDAPGSGDFDVAVNRLYQNEPNPFNPRTAIRFSVAARGPVDLSIYDVGGRLVRTIVDKPMDAGLHTVVWDGMDNSIHKVGSGIYWSRLKVGDYVSNKKMLLLK